MSGGEMSYTRSGNSSSWRNCSNVATDDEQNFALHAADEGLSTDYRRSELLIITKPQHSNGSMTPVLSRASSDGRGSATTAAAAIVLTTTGPDALRPTRVCQQMSESVLI